MAGNGISVRVWKNKLPNLARALDVDVDEVLAEAAEVTRETWSDDVRVSDGPGGYNGTHYRDNIAVERVTKNTYTVSTPVPYAEYNERGSVTISPKPSMATGRAAGERYLSEELVRRIDEAGS